MEKKQDYRSKEQKERRRILELIGIVIVAIILLYIISHFLSRNTTTTQDTSTNSASLSYKSIDEYESLEELLNQYGCTYISETDTTNFLTVYLKFNIDLYTDDTSNENFFTNLVKTIAVYENYKSFELIDEERDIDIVVTCEDESIVEIEINGDNNYYLNEDSRRNSQLERTTVTKFEVESSELQSLVDNNWNPSGLNLGSKDSTCNNYDIYFDEGFEYKVVGQTIYNMIFTEKYDGSIISGLNANSTVEEIESILGEATYEYNSTIYGYLGENFYVFFDFLNNEVSIYPVQTITEEEEEEFIALIEEMNADSNVKQFSMDLTSLWTDYDIYDYDSNYVNLQYTLKGIQLTISSSSLKNGIYIYQNYGGTINNVNGLDNVYVQEEDSVFEEEKVRAMKEELVRIEEGDYTEEELEELGTKFSVRFRETDNKGPLFYSRDKKYPDTELSQTLTISSYNWYDEYNFIYSVDNDGIYIFNCISNLNQKIIDVSNKIKINSAGDGKIIYNDTEEININIE